MSARAVDRNSVRGGAAVSAVALVIAFIFDLPGLVAAMCVALGFGALFGLRTSPLGWTYRSLKRLLSLKIPVEPEPEAPPRFAQTLGFVFTGAGVGFLLAGADGVGWAFALLVAALQALLAITGICIGCEMYLFGKRLTARGA